MPKVSPVPFRIPIIDPRTQLIDRNWQQFFNALLERIGGVGDVPSNAELATAVTGDTPFDTMAIWHQVQQRIQDLEAQTLFTPAPRSTAIDTTDVLPERPVADMERLWTAVHDLEALIIWGN